ncbi:MAG: MEDS domain-containing protein [Candidatus Bathyarchaeota archaeon]|nr:MAG: MEDS domain-containing protein [Candidatus Bathyarchaeota archaeon]
MPKLPIIDSLRQKWKRSIPPDVLKPSPVLNFREGESKIVTYTSAADKMKIFSAFIRYGLENGDAVFYLYPDEENEIVRAKLREYGIDVEKSEREGTLFLSSLTEHFMPNGKLDYEKAVANGLNWWAEAKKKRYKHVRDIGDVGDFSFVNGQWQKYITDYWLDPRWEDPNVSEWVVDSGKSVGVVYDPFLMEITAINVEHMTEQQVIELLKAFGEGAFESTKFIDLLQDINSFSRSIGLNHERLVGRKILLEFDPASDYEKAVDSLTRESMANVEPIFVFTSKTSSIYSRLAEEPAIKFFLTSISTSVPTSTSENTVLLPVNNMPLILDATNKILENYGNGNVCFVFDILSGLLTSVGQEKTCLFLHRALELLASEKTTTLFLFNPSAHESQVVSSLKNLFSNQLTYDKNGLETVKTS